LLNQPGGRRWRLRVVAVVAATLAGLLGPAAVASAEPGGEASAATAARSYADLRAELEQRVKAEGLPMPKPGQEMRFTRTARNGLVFIECIGSVGDVVRTGAVGTFPPFGGVRVSTIIVCSSPVARIDLTAAIVTSPIQEIPDPTVDESSVFGLGLDNRLSLDVTSNLSACFSSRAYIGFALGVVTFPDGFVDEAAGFGPAWRAFPECLS
jgi:hypothetical protein